MIDKLLVKQRFERSFKTYDNNAVIQKLTAKNLINMLKTNNFESIFETGCATGILTKEIKENLNFKVFYANDLVEMSKEYVKTVIPEAVFINGDIEIINPDKKFDLIISNASLQWCNDFYSTTDKLSKLLTSGGTLAFTVFGENNLKEIKEVFETKSKTFEFSKSDSEFFNNEKFSEIIIEEEEIRLEFNSLTEILKHLKSTGVNALMPFKLTKTSLQAYEQKYRETYGEGEKVYLTYNPVYVVLKKRNRH